jgi:hypothetical protein
MLLPERLQTYLNIAGCGMHSVICSQCVGSAQHLLLLKVQQQQQGAGQHVLAAAALSYIFQVPVQHSAGSSYSSRTPSLSCFSGFQCSAVSGFGTVVAG